jgi:ribosomal subunit interface protein
MKNIVTKGVHIKATKAIINRVNEQFSHLLEHYDNLIVKDIEVSVDVDSKHTQNTNFIKARIPIKGNDIFVNAKGEDMYKIIGDAVDKASNKLRKIKTKIKTKSRFNKRLLAEETLE